MRKSKQPGKQLRCSFFSKIINSFLAFYCFLEKDSFTDVCQITKHTSGGLGVLLKSFTFEILACQQYICFAWFCLNQDYCAYGAEINHIKLLMTHCIKSVRKRNYSGPYSVRVHENTGKNNSEYGYFSRSYT